MSQQEDQLLDLMLAEVRTEVPVADQKASILLAAIGIGAGAVFGGLLAGDWSPGHLNTVAETFWGIGAALIIAAAATAGCAVWPRIRGDEDEGHHYYWRHIAQHATLDAFSDALKSDPMDNRARTEYQLWHLSKIVNLKYSLIRRSLALTAIAVTCLLVSAGVA